MNEKRLPDDVQLFNPKQVAEALGVSSKSVLRWIQSGKIKGQKLGPRQYRVSKSELEQFLNQTKEETRIEFEKQRKDNKSA